MLQSQIFDRAYYQGRLERNRLLAEGTDNPAIRSIHLEYVRLYEQLLEESMTEPGD